MLKVTDLNVEKNVPLVSPQALMSEIERTEKQAQFVADSRTTIENILKGEDDRFLVVVGPCSIHDTEAGLDYAKKLAVLAEEVKDKIYVVMRVYFEKPRTTVGWKGLIMDPDLDGSADIPKGLKMARQILKDVIDLGIPTATELLDPITPQYIADLISWSAIGARTTESQTHRQMASGLSMPIGFKNGTMGSIDLAVNAIKAASAPQSFLGVSDEGVASAVTTKGNDYCHIILRGGANGPNYDAESVAATEADLEKAGLRQTLIIDASHANCNKDYNIMPSVFEDIIDQRAAGNKNLVGAMLESNLVEGNQKISEDMVYGKSVTDQCINWDVTEQLLRDAASKL